MRELRISIPFVGGVTAVYTREEVDLKKIQVRKSVSSFVSTTTNITRKGISKTALLLSRNLGRLADYIDPTGGVK
jgi:hypothetical protein